MILQMAYKISIALLLLAFYTLFKVMTWTYWRYKTHKIFIKHGIPGPKPNYFSGNMTAIRSASNPNDVITRWVKEHGKVFGYFMGQIPYMVVSDKEMLKDIMFKQSSNFVNRANIFMKNCIIDHTVVGLLDQRWREVRSVLTPTFSSSKLKRLVKTINRTTAITIKIIQEKVEKKQDFDIHTLFKNLTVDVITNSTLTLNINCQESPTNTLSVAIEQFFIIAAGKTVDLAYMFPFITHIIKFFPMLFRIGRVLSTLEQCSRKVVKYRKENPSTRAQDYLQLLLDTTEDNSEDIRNGRRIALTEEEIVANICVFIVAGYETLSFTLTVTFHLLATHLEVQERLHIEISEACKSSELTYDLVHSLKYLDQVLSESLRMYPSDTRFINRKCKKTCRIGGYTIPEGVAVHAPVWEIHHDPELWPDPWAFNPDRFSPENRHNISNTTYFPFGIGQRNCIGMRFALLKTKLVTAHLIKEFKFIPCEKTRIPLPLASLGLTVVPEKEVFVRAVTRTTTL